MDASPLKHTYKLPFLDDYTCLYDCFLIIFAIGVTEKIIELELRIILSTQRMAQGLSK